jgi:hypothetical protein
MRTALFAAALLPAALLTAEQPTRELTARELFYVPAASAAPADSKRAAKPAPPAPKPVRQAPRKPKPEEPQVLAVVNPSYEGPRPLGLRYSVGRIQAGEPLREVPVDSVFHSGDSVGIAVQPNESAFLYVISRGASGKWQVLFPQQELNGGDNWVEGGKRFELPGNERAWTFDSQKGTEKLFVVLSRKEVDDLEKLIYDLNEPAKAAPRKPVEHPKAPATRTDAAKPLLLSQSASPIDDALVGRLRSQVLARDLILEKVARKEYALYAVDKSGKPDARLVVDVELKHE